MSRAQPASLTLATVLLVQLVAAGPAHGQERGYFSTFTWPSGVAAVAISAGATNVALPSDEAQLNWELQFPDRELRLFSGRLHLPGITPVAGAMAASDGSFYAYAGVRAERSLGASRFWVSPSFAAGLYYRDDGKNLGGALQFRSGIELAYRLQQNRRLGLVLFHLSNGGVYDGNPGTESLLLTYSTHLR